MDANYEVLINDALEKNEDLKKHKEILFPIIEYIWNIMPESNQVNFLYNLRSVKFNLDLDITDVINTDVQPDSLGEYDPEEQRIEINDEAVCFLYEQYKDQDNGLVKFNQALKRVVLHEFLHLASSRNLGSLYCGISKYNDFESDEHTGLTEGITSYIVLTAYPKAFITETDYYLETLIAAQLIEILGKDIMFEAYFNNKGFELIEEGINNLITQPQLAKKLMNSIEKNFNSRKALSASFTLGKVQDILVKLFELKLMKSPGDELERIDRYKQVLISKQKLYNLGHYPAGHLGLNKGYENMQRIERKYKRLERRNQVLERERVNNGIQQLPNE